MQRLVVKKEDLIKVMEETDEETGKEVHYYVINKGPEQEEEKIINDDDTELIKDIIEEKLVTGIEIGYDHEITIYRAETISQDIIRRSVIIEGTYTLPTLKYDDDNAYAYYMYSTTPVIVNDWKYTSDRLQEMIYRLGKAIVVNTETKETYTYDRHYIYIYFPRNIFYNGSPDLIIRYDILVSSYNPTPKQTKEDNKND